MTLTYENNLDGLKRNHRAKYLRLVSFCSKVIVRKHTDTYTADRLHYTANKAVGNNNPAEKSRRWRL